MKFRNILPLVAALVSAMSLPSCLKDQADIFDEPASTRLNNALAHARDVLASAENGWKMYYYPDLDYGGYAFTLQFTDKEVTVGSELFPEEDGYQFVTSNYKMTTDDGPVISMDTYNEVFHFLSTPNSNLYEAYGGDFEFLILQAEADSVTLKGKKNGNIFKLYPLDKAPEQFLANIDKLSSSFFIGSARTTVTNGATVAEFDLDNRQFSIARKNADFGEALESPFIFTEDGFSLYEVLDFQGVKFKEFTYDAENRTVTGSGITFTMIIPDGYIPYEDYAGQYTLYTGIGNYDVTLEPLDENRSFTLKGLNKAFDVVINYNPGTGLLSWLSQQVGTLSDGTGVWLCAWDSNEGYLTWSTSIGMVSTATEEDGKFTVVWADNEVWGGYVVDSFLLWKISGGSSAGNMSGQSGWYFSGGDYRLPRVTKMVKK